MRTKQHWLISTVLCSTIVLVPAVTSAQNIEPSAAYYVLNDVVTVVPTTISVPEIGNVSTQIISRQDIGGDIGFVWNITLRYQFILPDQEEILKISEGRKFGIPNTIEYQTHITHRASESDFSTQLIDGGTANTSGLFASSIDIEFADANALTEYVASGAELDLLSVIKFPQVTSVAPDTDDIEQIILDYLSTNLIAPDAPVLTTYTELLEQHPDVVGRNPAVTISALASIFEQSTISVDGQGSARLEMPPAFNVNFNAAFSVPRNVRFTDRSVARGKIKLCDEADVILLEVGLTGCENIERLVEKFEQ